MGVDCVARQDGDAPRSALARGLPHRRGDPQRVGEDLLGDARGLEEPAVGEEPFEDHALAAQDVHPDAHRREDRHELDAEGVRQGEGRVRGVGEQGARGLQAEQGLAGKGVVGQQAPSVRVAGHRIAVEQVVGPGDGDLCARQARELDEQGDPRVDLGGAVVGVDHRDRRAVGGGHHVDLQVEVVQRLLQDDHEEHGGAAGDVAALGGDGVGGDHPRPGVALGRAHGDSGQQGPGRVDQEGPLLGQGPRLVAGGQDCGQELGEVPGHQAVDQVRVGGQAPRVVGTGGGVDGEHAGGVADAQDVAAGELLVDPSGQGVDGGDAHDVGLARADRLVEVGDGPAKGDVDAEELGQLGRGLGGVGVAPGAELGELAPFRVEGQVAVHHPGDADGAVGGRREPVLVAHVVDQRRVGAAQPRADLVEGVGPQAVVEVALPAVRARGEDLVVRSDQNGFDAGGAEFDSECGVAVLDECSRVGGHCVLRGRR